MSLIAEEIQEIEHAGNIFHLDGVSHVTLSSYVTQLQISKFSRISSFVFQGMKVDKLTSVSSVSSTVMVPEETPEELALVISPEPTVKTFSLFDPNPPSYVQPRYKTYFGLSTEFRPVQFNTSAHEDATLTSTSRDRNRCLEEERGSNVERDPQQREGDKEQTNREKEMLLP